MSRTQHSFKASLGTPRLKIGMFILEFVSPGIGDIYKSAGFDFALFDLEHTGYTYETAKAVTKYMQAADLPLIIRVPSREYHDISRGLDVGPDGVMLPMVSSAEEAKRIVNGAKYYPRGARGAAMGLAQDRFKAGSLIDAFAANNERTILAMQIETVAAVEAADEIAAIEGVDILWVGHQDLSTSLGIPGDLDNPKFSAAVQKVRKACRKYGKSMGGGGGNVQAAAKLYRQGFDVQTYSADVWLMQALLTKDVHELRCACEAGSTVAVPAPRRRPRK